MIRVLFTTLALFWGAAMTADAQAQDGLEALLQAHVDAAIEKERLPAAAVSFITAKDGIVASVVAGVRRNDGEDAAQKTDKWHIGSDAKAMTAALYAVLVEVGDAQWGATMPDLFPDLADTIDPAWSAITVEHLLSHRSGMGDFPITSIGKMRADQRPIVEQRLDVARNVLSRPPKKTTGKFSYSNQGYVIAGAAIERITGKSWEESIQSLLFDRLEHGDEFGFGPPQGDQPEGHRKLLFFTPLKPAGQAWETADNPKLLGPAGTAHASHAAWADFIMLFLTKNDVLSEDSISRLVTPWPADDRQQYALGWGYAHSPTTDSPVLNHAGSNTMWYALVGVSREKGAAILLTTNRGGLHLDPILAKIAEDAFSYWLSNQN